MMNDEYSVDRQQTKKMLLFNENKELNEINIQNRFEFPIFL